MFKKLPSLINALSEFNNLLTIYETNTGGTVDITKPLLEIVIEDNQIKIYDRDQVRRATFPKWIIK